MELLLATAALTAALSAPARAYKTYSLSTGENFGLESFLRFEGALVIRDEDEEEYANKAYRFLIVVHYSEECTQCSKYLKELLHFKDIAHERGYEVGYAAKEYTDDEEFIEKHVKDLKTEMPYVFEVRDNNLGKSMIYEYSKDAYRTDGVSATAFADWLEKHFLGDRSGGDGGSDDAAEGEERGVAAAEDGVHGLDDDNYDYFVLNQKHALVLLQSKDCYDCNKTLSEFSRLVRLGRRRVHGVGDGGAVVVAAVNHTSAPLLFKRMELDDRTTDAFSLGRVLYWGDRMMYEYRGHRRASSMLKFLMVQMKSQLLRPLNSVSHIHNFNAGVGARFTTVAFMDASNPKLLFEIQKAAAQSIAVPFGITYRTANAFDHFGVKERYSLVLFDNVLSTHESLPLPEEETDKVSKEIKLFVLSRLMPPVLEVRNKDDMDVLMDENTERYQLVIFLPRSDPILKEKLEVDFAPAFRDLIQTAIVLAPPGEAGANQSESAEVGRRLMRWFDVNRGQMPTFRIRRRIRPDFHQKYKPEKASKSVSLEAMKSLLESLDAEDATKRPEPYARSQDIPISWNKGPVKILVGENFKKLAVDAKTNVLVMLYESHRVDPEEEAPDGLKKGRDLLDALSESGEFGQDKDNTVTFAVMDCSKNEAIGMETLLLDGENLPRNPYLVYFGHSSNKPYAYEKELNEENLKAFLRARHKPIKQEL